MFRWRRWVERSPGSAQPRWPLRLLTPAAWLPQTAGPWLDVGASLHGPVTLRTSGARGLLHALVPGAQRVRVAALETLETGAQICTCPSATCQESRDGQRLHFWTSGAVRGPCSSQVCRGCPKRGKRASRRARRTAGLRSAFSPGPGHGAQLLGTSGSNPTPSQTFIDMTSCVTHTTLRHTCGRRGRWRRG